MAPRKPAQRKIVEVALPASDPGAFCADVVLHPALAYPGELVLTHGVGSFDRPEGTAPEEIRARLATFPVPSSLP